MTWLITAVARRVRQRIDHLSKVDWLTFSQL